MFALTGFLVPASAQQPEISGEPIPYDHLANQETDPFLFSGRLMDENHPRWRQYSHAIGQFQDVRDCLVEEEHGKGNPNLLLIDWDQTGMGRGTEVCVFLIARSLGSVELIRRWLEYHMFRATSVNRSFSDSYVPYYKTQPVSNMSAYWTVEQYREQNPSLLRTLTGFDLALRYEIVLQFSEINQIVGVVVVIPSK